MSEGLLELSARLDQLEKQLRNVAAELEDRLMSTRFDMHYLEREVNSLRSRLDEVSS